MSPSDKVDDFLAKAGAEWRAGQPSAPEPDLDRLTGETGRRKRHWAPALAAASVAVIATVALLVLPGKEQPRVASPIQTLATGNSADPARLLVRNGDQVEVDGQVIAPPGKPVLYCAPHAEDLVGHLPGKEPAPTCPAGFAVELTGVDLNRLSSPSTMQGIRTGQAHLVGIWTERTIAVRGQSAPRPRTDDDGLPQVPCKEPSGGWQPDTASQSISQAVTTFVNARPDELAEPWIGRPAGVPAGASQSPDGKSPSVLVIEVAQGDVAGIRTALTKLYAGNLCVVKGRFSQASTRETLNAVAALHDKGFGITSSGGGMGNRPVGVELLVVDQDAFAEFRKIGLDKLELTPAVVPVR
ncbi:MAG: hypothetical protein QOG10_236 [Kribbellaceae bacterium]|jgi:hypothetical protein|nr:hypothetical protein [Kribbellaceae bacterium]